MDITFHQLVTTIMRKYDIDEIEVSFDGSSDQGFIEEPSVIMDVENAVNFNEKYKDKINEDIEKIVKSSNEECGLLDIVNELLDKEFNRNNFKYKKQHHIFHLVKLWVDWYMEKEFSGWQDGDGMNGAFNWFKEKDTCHFVRNVPVTTYEEYSQEL